MGTTKFAKGSRVVALENDFCGGYKKGDEFTLTGVVSNSVRFVDNDDESRIRPASEFELVPDAPATGKFKVGDRVTYSDDKCSGIGVIHEDNCSTSWFVKTEDRHRQFCIFDGGTTRVFEASDLRPATLTIEAGKFYKTRDGRKVGPMSKYDGDSWCTPGDGSLWVGSGERYFGPDGGGPTDLIAEWVDEPAAVANDNAPAEKPAAERPVAKFKVGDRVKLVREGLSTTGAIGLTAVIESLDMGGGDNPILLRFDQGDLHRFSTLAVTKEYTRANVKGIEPIKSEKPFTFSGGIFRAEDFRIAGWPSPRPAIVCLIENGHPKPADRPHVHSSASNAEREAARLAGKYKGREFGVYELVSTKREEPEHEWQRLAADGQRVTAAIALRDSAGISFGLANSAVRAFLEAA